MISRYAIDFSGALQSIVNRHQDEQEHFSFLWSTFPNGVCDSTSYLFALFLHEFCGIEKTRIRVGMGGTGGIDSHVWNIIDGSIFDLTEHQYDKGSGKPSIEKKLGWQNKLRGCRTTNYEEIFHGLNPLMAYGCGQMLPEIIKILPDNYTQLMRSTAKLV